MIEPPLFRTGRKVGRTIYRQVEAEPSDADVLLGVMDTADLAALAVEAMNLSRGEGMVAISVETLNKLGAEHERYRTALEKIEVMLTPTMPAPRDDQRDRVLAFIQLVFAKPKAEDCDHRWIDVRNEVVESGEFCPKCRSIRPTP